MAEHCPQDHPQDCPQDHPQDCPQDHPQDRPEDTIANAKEYDRITQRWLDRHLVLSIKGRAVTIKPNNSTIGENLLNNHNKKKAPSPHIKTLDIHNWVDKEALARFHKTNIAPSCVYDAKRRRHADEEESDDDGQHAKRVCG